MRPQFFNGIENQNRPCFKHVFGHKQCIYSIDLSFTQHEKKMNRKYNFAFQNLTHSNASLFLSNALISIKGKIKSKSLITVYETFLLTLFSYIHIFNLVNYVNTSSDSIIKVLKAMNSTFLWHSFSHLHT